MNKMNKFVLSTLVAAAAMTSTAWAESTSVTVSSADEIKEAISTVNNASGGTIDFGTVAYEYKVSSNNDADMATITNAGTYTITGGNGALLNYELEVNPEKSAGTYVVALDNAYITMAKLTLRENAKLSLIDSRLDYNGIEATGGISYLSVYSNSKLNISGSVVGYNPYKTSESDPKAHKWTNTNGDMFGPRFAIYGEATIANSTIYAGPSASLKEGFDVLGNATASVSGSTLYTALINVGTDPENGTKRLHTDDVADYSAGTLSASLVLDKTAVYNNMYRGDGAAYSGIRVGTDTTTGVLTITNGSTIDFTKRSYGDATDVGLSISAKGIVNISDSSVAVMKVTNNGTLTVSGSTVTADTITNNGTFTVTGTSTLNIGALTGSSGSVNLQDGAIIKDSTVGGKAYVAGNVTFRGVNTFAMITDYGDYYSKETPSMWTVEKGASLTLTNTDRYGLGYGDKVAVYGEIENARAEDLRDTLTDADASLNLYGGLVGMTNSAAPNAENSFTVKDAYVIFGVQGDKSFGNKPNYYGNYTFSFDNSVVTANGFKFYEDYGKSMVSFKDSDLLVDGVFMTNDTNSTFTFENSVVVSKAKTNGSDDKNQNAGTLNLINSSLTYNAAFTNVGTVNISGGTLSAPSISGAGRIVANGKVDITFDSLTDTRLFIGRHYDENNNKVMHDEPFQRSTVNLNSVSGNGIAVSSSIFNFNNADLIANDNVSLDVTNDSYLFMSNTSVDLKGNEMTVDGRFVLGEMVLSNGTFVFDMDGKSGPTSCFQVNNRETMQSNVIESTASVSVKNGPFGFYADTVIKGSFEASSIQNAINLGANDTDNDLVDKATVTVFGLLSTDGSLTVNKYNTDELNAGKPEYQRGVLESELIIDGGSVSVGTVLTNNGIVELKGGSLSAGSVVNNGTIEVGEGSVLTATAITGTGDVVLAGTVEVGSLTADELTIVVGDVSLNTAAVMLLAESGDASVSVNKLTVVADNAEGLDLSTILASKVGADMAGAIADSVASESSSVEFVLQNSSGLTYETTVDATTGKLTVGALTPEPSAFGLLAGLGAIALAVSRRRRNRR